MDELSRILEKIDVTTNCVKVDVLQELLLLSKQNFKCHSNIEFWNEITKKIWVHLMQCFEKLDDQLLCAICFYSTITLTDQQDLYLTKLQNLIVCLEPVRSELKFNLTEDEHSVHILQVVSLSYGMFQSSFLTQNAYQNIPKIVRVLKDMFDILLLMGYQYSQYTFLVFKILKSFKKLCGGPLEKYIYNKENQIKLLQLVNNNWENPVTGVRGFNRIIFQTVLSTLDEETYKTVFNEVNRFYWNKAKYLMLTEIIESHTGSLSSLVQVEWIDGLIYSLHRSGLVSAGADMYYSILKKINTEDIWCQLFFKHIINILVGTDIKAIENFNNYWYLSTLKMFEGIAHVLINELEKQENFEECLYSKLCLLKQANKVGIVDKNLNKAENTTVKKAILSGIKHCNSNIRVFAFDIVCVSQGKTFPNSMEYSLILDYLYNNINVDSTVLRLNMFNSFHIFLAQLHAIFINIALKYEHGEDMYNLLDFCKKLQYLVIHNLNIKGNYQRKITCVKLCSYILTSFSEIPKKKKGQTCEPNITLKVFLKEKELWLLSTEEFIMKLISLLNDPSEDVRENIVGILLSHYSEELHTVTLLTPIINSANKNIRGKFFYEINCSCSMFKLLVNLLLKQNNSIQAEYSRVEDIFDFAYNEIISYHQTPINIMDSIETGKQLHAFMSVLLIVLEGCISKSYKINIHSKIPEFLPVLEHISKQLSWEEEGSSDFSKMTSMVHTIIKESEYNICNQYNPTKVSGLQHIVLNCLSLNVKASCDLASILIQYNKNNADICKQCLDIIIRVLETSRHKGVIEAAGVALGKGIQYLTALSKITTNIPEDKLIVKNKDVSELPLNLLKWKLNYLISETNKMSSITRRGAGLSIMMHRIVSSDMQKGKPLFHYFMKTLLQVCKTKARATDYQPIEINDDTMENQVDLPEAIYIHLMTRIVTDSSLSTETMCYSVELAEIAFGNLTNPHWQIRNAALQLYGALIPRLIGQKKACGTDEETIATVACDEMRTHLPKLWEYIIVHLKQECLKDDIQAHSNLVPVLNLLANSAKRYTFSLTVTEHESEFDNLFNHLVFLLNSPIYTVRRLTARTIFNLYEFDYICEGITRQNNITENFLHGLLLLLNFCHKSYQLNSNHENSFKKLYYKFNHIFNTGIHSYINRKLYEDIYYKDIDMQCIENTLMEVRNNNHSGVYCWAEARLNKYINNCTWNNVPSVLKIILQQRDYEKYCEYILMKIKTEHDIPTDILLEIADILNTFENRFQSCIVWKIIFSISLKTNPQINTEAMLKILNGKFSYNLRYMIPVLVNNIVNINDEYKGILIAIIEDLSDFENSDVDKRYIAALAINELAYEFNKLPDDFKVRSIKCAVVLLQDEVEDIRNLVKFYSILSKEKTVFQPYISLNKILDKNFLCDIFHDPEGSLKQLYDILNHIVSYSNHIKEEYNPFANDSKNIYFEPDVLKQALDLILNK